MDYAQLRDAYTRVKKACGNDWRSDAASQDILDFVALSLRFLATECEQVDLNSLVPNKKYISFFRNNIVARPANRDFFMVDLQSVMHDWRSWSLGNSDSDEFECMFYTVALAPCLAMELFDRNNKKGPATYFECLIRHIFARVFGFEPVKQAVLSVSGRRVRMTMDFLFETRDDAANIHLPVKMSTRERVVQAWAHQRLLDSAYGRGSYKGIMILFSETKLDSRSREVVEICVPDQWLVYQTLLSKMGRIYYFDIPVRYRELTNDFSSTIQIKPFYEFLTEIESVVGR